jgi:hypothetical protein
VVANLVERSRLYGVLLSPAKTNGDGCAAANTLVTDNIFRDCGGCDPDAILPGPGAVIVSDGVAPQRLGQNRFEGEAKESAVLPPTWHAWG